MEQLRCAVIGTGHLGKHHTRILSYYPGTQLVGVCDNNAMALDEVSKTYNVPVYKDYHDLLGKVDAVVIATPTVTHKSITVDFLDAGSHVFVEKPISATVEEAEQMVQTANDLKLVLQVGHSERFNPAFIAAKPFIEKPLFIESHRLNTFAPRGIDVDVVLDLMIHDLDMVLHFMEDFPASIDSIGIPVLSNEIDIANTRLHFPSGTVANITASRVSVNPIRKFRIFQKDTYISIDFKNPQVSIYKRNPPAKNEKYPQIQQVQVQVASKEPLRGELEDFIHAIQTGEKPQVNGETGLKSLKAAMMVLQGINKSAFNQNDHL